MNEGFVIVKLKTCTRTIRAGGRSLRHEGPFGNLHCLGWREALRLVECRAAKLLPQFSRTILVAQVEALRDEVEDAHRTNA